mmetsp:Transcript_16966/g.42054  ORF Transcript_16966/g.42054 Transcript_16966/m.42054 type:complete len:165 (+) Transcript_16966:1651-2145(+)
MAFLFLRRCWWEEAAFVLLRVVDDVDSSQFSAVVTPAEAETRCAGFPEVDGESETEEADEQAGSLSEDSSISSILFQPSTLLFISRCRCLRAARLFRLRRVLPVDCAILCDLLVLASAPVVNVNVKKVANKKKEEGQGEGQLELDLERKTYTHRYYLYLMSGLR